VVDAHLTLFHAVPAALLADVGEALAEAARRAPIPLSVDGTRLLGRGVAVRLASAELLELRAVLARRWWPSLTAQDRGKKELHVTVQNKVDAAQARELAAQLELGGLPAAATATGLALWRYLGGPWEPIARYPFTP
jgi:2'-5' RNA ligase